jgi:hypothetical protein
MMNERERLSLFTYEEQRVAKHGVVKGVVSRGGEDQGIYSGAPLQPSARGEPRSPEHLSRSLLYLHLPAASLLSGQQATPAHASDLITNKHARVSLSLSFSAMHSMPSVLLHRSEWRRDQSLFCFCDSIAAARALTVSRGAARVTNMEISFNLQLPMHVILMGA